MRLTSVLMLFFSLFSLTKALGQTPYQLRSGDYTPPNSWSTQTTMGNSASGTYILIAKPNGTGNKYFRFRDNGNNVGYGPTGANDIQETFDTPFNLESQTGDPAKAYYYTIIDTSYTYIFKSNGSGNPGTSRACVLVTSQSPATVDSVTRNPTGAVLPKTAVTVTATLNKRLPIGQGVYLRYESGTNGYANATITQLQMHDSIHYTAVIPDSAYNSNAVAGSMVSYYIFTSGDSLTIPNKDADLMTINLNNNGGGLNYYYTVFDNTYYTVKDGLWNNTATWYAGLIPDTTGGATVQINNNVSLTNRARVKSLLINNAGELQINDSLKVVDTLHNTGTLLLSHNTPVKAGVLQCDSLSTISCDANMNLCIASTTVVNLANGINYIFTGPLVSAPFSYGGSTIYASSVTTIGEIALNKNLVVWGNINNGYALDLSTHILTLYGAFTGSGVTLLHPASSIIITGNNTGTAGTINIFLPDDTIGTIKMQRLFSNARLKVNGPLYINDSLILDNGILQIQHGYALNIANPAGNGIVIGTNNSAYTLSWIAADTVTRNLSVNTNTYAFPIGDTLLSKAFILINNNLTGVHNLKVWYGKLLGNDSGFAAAENGNIYAGINGTIVWYTQPDAALTSGSYSAQCYLGSINVSNNRFGILMRPLSSQYGYDWHVPAGSYLNPYNSAGNLSSDGYAQRNNIAEFGQMGIGILSYNVNVQGIDPLNNDTRIFPNPAATVLNFNTNELTQVDILSLQGQIISHYTFNNGIHSLNIASLVNGMYFIRFTTSGPANIQHIYPFVKVSP